jgi:hypothetical protein
MNYIHIFPAWQYTNKSYQFGAPAVYARVWYTRKYGENKSATFIL